MGAEKIMSELEREKANIWALIAWILGIIGFIIVYCIKYDDDFAMFHAKQSLILTVINVIALVVIWVFGMAPGIGIMMYVLNSVMKGLTIVISLAGAYFSLKGVRYKFPILYELSQMLSI